ncbi:unnamed protein product [Rhizopus stolonifer]
MIMLSKTTVLLSSKNPRKKKLVFVCKKGSGCKDWINISSLDRKRIIPSKKKKMNCPYIIRLSKKNNGKGYQINTSKVLREISHNHSLDDDTRSHFNSISS